MKFTRDLIIANFKDSSLICNNQITWKQTPSSKNPEKSYSFFYIGEIQWNSYLLLSNIQFMIFFPAQPEKSKIQEIKLPRKISCHMVNCERVCFSCNLSAFVYSGIAWVFRAGKSPPPLSAPPFKSESARTPMTIGGKFRSFSGCNIRGQIGFKKPQKFSRQKT